MLAFPWFFYVVILGKSLWCRRLSKGTWKVFLLSKTVWKTIAFFCAVLKSDSVKKIVNILCYSIIIFLVNSYFRFQIQNIKNILKRYTMFLFFNFSLIFFPIFSIFFWNFKSTYARCTYVVYLILKVLIWSMNLLKKNV